VSSNWKAEASITAGVYITGRKSCCRPSIQLWDYAQLMGHAKVDTTLNVYTQVIDGALRTAVDKVGSELFTIVRKSEMGAELTH
jgi:hypothetical protein